MNIKVLGFETYAVSQHGDSVSVKGSPWPDSDKHVCQPKEGLPAFKLILSSMWHTVIHFLWGKEDFLSGVARVGAEMEAEPKLSKGKCSQGWALQQRLHNVICGRTGTSAWRRRCRHTGKNCWVTAESRQAHVIQHLHADVPLGFITRFLPLLSRFIHLFVSLFVYVVTLRK